MPDLTIHPYRLTWQEGSSSTNQPTASDSKSALAASTSHVRKGPSTGPVVYSFTPVSIQGNNMISLVPRAASVNTRPKYYISSMMNVFMPLSYITTVYRGEGEDKVGEFEMGISTTPASVEIQNARAWLKNILSRVRGGRTDGVWRWTPRNAPDRHLEWDYSSASTARCYSRQSKGLLATYKYSNQACATHAQELEVTPDGQSFFDHIILSLLIVERKRLTPTRFGLSKLWNF